MPCPNCGGFRTESVDYGHSYRCLDCGHSVVIPPSAVDSTEPLPQLPKFKQWDILNVSREMAQKDEIMDFDDSRKILEKTGFVGYYIIDKDSAYRKSIKLKAYHIYDFKDAQRIAKEKRIF